MFAFLYVLAKLKQKKKKFYTILIPYHYYYYYFYHGLTRKTVEVQRYTYSPDLIYKFNPKFKRRSPRSVFISQHTSGTLISVTYTEIILYFIII